MKIKISETVRELKKAINTNVDTEIKILGHNYYNTLSMFLTESSAIITPYFVSKVRQTPPIFIFKKFGQSCFYDKLKTDISALISDAVDIKGYTINSEKK